MSDTDDMAQYDSSYEGNVLVQDVWIVKYPLTNPKSYIMNNTIHVSEA